MKKLVTSIAFVALLSVNALFAQFEGIIEFDKIKTETTKYSYAVKGDKVRIEETESDGSIKGIMIVDLANETVTALSPERKLYMDATNKRVLPTINPKVDKTSNKKTINGYECTEWIATYDVEDTQISYWVLNEKDFAFFDKLLKVLNRKDNLARYFISIPEHEGRFTMAGVEKDTGGMIKTELKVTKLERKTLEDNVFDIPKEYQKFER